MHCELDPTGWQIDAQPLEKKTSKYAHEFGKGAIEGVAAEMKRLRWVAMNASFLSMR